MARGCRSRAKQWGHNWVLVFQTSPVLSRKRQVPWEHFQHPPPSYLWGAGLEFHLLTNPLLASATVCPQGGTKGHQAEPPTEQQGAASIRTIKGVPLPGLLPHAQEALMQRGIC